MTLRIPTVLYLILLLLKDFVNFLIYDSFDDLISKTELFTFFSWLNS